MSRRRVGSWGGVNVGDLRKRWDREDVHVYGETDSTSTIAREMADEGAPAGTIVVARAQTAGRGRGDASFHSPADAGIYLTMVFRPEGDWKGAPVTILAGLGVALELRRTFPELRPRLKWPNDLIADGRKLGGILAETAGGSDGPDHLILGVGVNLDTGDFPADLRDRVVGVRDLVGAEPAEVADAIVRGLERWLHEPPEALTEEMLEELDRLDHLKNRRIALSGVEENPIEGRATGLAPDGALLFRPDRGALRRVQSGSVDVLGDGS